MILLSEQQDRARTLRVRRSLEPQPAYAYYLAYAPTGRATLQTPARVAGQRWQIEQALQAAQGECGSAYPNCATCARGCGGNDTDFDGVAPGPQFAADHRGEAGDP